MEIDFKKNSDTTSLDTACHYFRQICQQIGMLIGKLQFKGSFIQITEFYAHETYQTKKGMQLAIALDGCKKLCVYQGKKLGLKKDLWFNYCWEQVSTDEKAIPLTLTAKEDGVTIKIYGNGKLSLNDIDLKYRLNNSDEWVDYKVGGTAITLAKAGDYVQLRNTTNTLSTSSSDYLRIFLYASISASGNVNSLINFSNELSDYCFYGLFTNCAKLTSATVTLPATTLAAHCYDSMFYGCTSLTTAPALPATTLADYCYYRLFYGCSSLVRTPELPATTLTENCYFSMFQGCSSLTEAPILSSTTLAKYCYGYMFRDCTSLTTAPALPATTLAESCYRGMFWMCTGLVEPPALPAHEITYACYYAMFSGCASLTTAPELPATTLADYCYGYMFRDCTSLTTATVLPATKLSTACYNNIFAGCTSLRVAPKLPDAALAEYCYNNMFNGCRNLVDIEVHFTSWGEGLFKDDNGESIDCFDNWVSGVSATGAFNKPAELPVEYGVNRIPIGWNSINKQEPLKVAVTPVYAKEEINNIDYPFLQGHYTRLNVYVRDMPVYVLDNSISLPCIYMSANGWVLLQSGYSDTTAIINSYNRGTLELHLDEQLELFGYYYIKDEQGWISVKGKRDMQIGL